MPPRGVKKGSKRGRQYEHIKESLESRGTSEDTAEEIAARTVNKERARHGEARESSRLSRTDISSGRRGGIRSHRRGPRGRTEGSALRGSAGTQHSGALQDDESIAPTRTGRPLTTAVLAEKQSVVPPATDLCCGVRGSAASGQIRR